MQNQIRLLFCYFWGDAFAGLVITLDFFFGPQLLRAKGPPEIGNWIEIGEDFCKVCLLTIGFLTFELLSERVTFLQVSANLVNAARA